MKHTREIIVRFEHCDSAGIVFYPRFMGLVNEMVEDWFAEMGASFKSLHIEQRKGVPTAGLSVEFKRPMRMGDTIEQSLRVLELGATSCTLHHEARLNHTVAAVVDQTIVFVDLDTMKAEPWPAQLRKAIERFKEAR